MQQEVVHAPTELRKRPPFGEVSGSYGVQCEDGCFLGSFTVYSGGSLLTF